MSSVFGEDAVKPAVEKKECTYTSRIGQFRGSGEELKIRTTEIERGALYHLRLGLYGVPSPSPSMPPLRVGAGYLSGIQNSLAGLTTHRSPIR